MNLSALDNWALLVTDRAIPYSAKYFRVFLTFLTIERLLISEIHIFVSFFD